jgi:hypothetical protein
VNSLIAHFIPKIFSGGQTDADHEALLPTAKNATT